MAKNKSKDMKCECMPKHHGCMVVCKAFWLTLFAVFLAHYLSDVLGIEKMASGGSIWGWIALFIWYVLFMVIGLKILYCLHHICVRK